MTAPVARAGRAPAGDREAATPTGRALPAPALSPFLRDSLAATFREAARASRTGPLGSEDRARELDQQARELEAGR